MSGEFGGEAVINCIFCEEENNQTYEMYPALGMVCPSCHTCIQHASEMSQCPACWPKARTTHSPVIKEN